MAVVTEIERIQLLVRRNYNMPPLPKALTALLHAIDSGEASAADLERIIASDPIMAADFLRVAQAAVDHDPRGLSTLRAMIVRLGFKSVRSLAMSVLVKRSFAHGQLDPNFDRVAFSRWSVATAVLGRYLYARKMKLEGLDSVWSADEIFASGLLANLGYALLDAVAPETYQRCWQLGQRHGTSVAGAFTLICGGPLSTLAAIAVESWGLPASFTHVIANLETPWRYPSEQEAISCVSMARYLAGEFGYRMEAWECHVDLPIEVTMDVSVPEEEMEVLAGAIAAATDTYVGSLAA
jgi:HD-like signal output (HDOD) protein